MSPSPRQRRCLWKTSSQTDNDSETVAAQREEEDTYTTILNRFASQPPQKSLIRLCSNSLVIVQEFCLTYYLLVRHRIAIASEQDERQTATKRATVERSTIAMYVALLLVLVYSSRAERVPQQSRQSKVRQRGTDGLLLAVLLRFLASLLRSLTASYSSDTVQALARAGMLLHLFSCDYSYANGKDPVDIGAVHMRSAAHEHRRPSFRGGAVALNAALFSTTLLVSRPSSSLSAYFFVSIAIVMFAFYPVTRCAIAASYPAHSSRKLLLYVPVSSCGSPAKSFHRSTVFSCAESLTISQSPCGSLRVQFLLRRNCCWTTHRNENCCWASPLF